MITENKEIIVSSCLFVLLLGLFCFMNNSLELYAPSVVQQANQFTAKAASTVLTLAGMKSVSSAEATISIHVGEPCKSFSSAPGFTLKGAPFPMKYFSCPR